MIQLNDGKYYNVTSAPIKKVAGSTKQVLEMFDDVTSGIELQQKLDDTKKQLEQTKYFAVIGELTTSIAHEIRNPLNAISNAISILDNVLPVEDDHAQILNIVKEESNRLNKIISKYIRYGKFPDLSMSRNNILKTIEDTVVLFKLDKKISDRIKFTTKFESNIPDLLYDKESIKQVFWNLLINSVSAIKGKGTINISVKTNKSFVNIDIKDNGIGIPENKINKIFEQFYTIKSQGTGIGLAIVRRIIDMHDWNIQVKSMFGSWTKFLIQAPIR
jgi:signal transduction histidine kinase